jgi:mitochondrial import receptor subunit TOM40
MESVPVSEKSSSPWSFITSNALVASATDALSSLQEKREALGLPCPGSVDRVAKEVESDVLLNNFSFTGLRADMTKTFSGGSPLFQVSHAFSMGSQVAPPYTFAVIYGTNKVC